MSKRWLRNDIERFKNALHFLDTCGDITEDKIFQAMCLALPDEDPTFLQPSEEHKKLKIDALFKNHDDPERAYLNFELDIARKALLKGIADCEDKLRAMGANPYKKWWQFWK